MQTFYIEHDRGIVVKNSVVTTRNGRTSRRVRVADSQMSEGCVVLRIDEDRGEGIGGAIFSFIFNLNSWYNVHTRYAY
jgi:hypothetical protein